MSPIRILPSFLVNQIAAGEVVERPASAIKEMIENSIDAGAQHIHITVRGGGKAYICVADDGCGMSREDLEKCVLRYATSKLPADDLLRIEKLGFRGEALPSIASVSKMLITSNNGSESNCVQIDGGNIVAVRPAAHVKGTKIEVSELFFNVPSRLSFLHTDRGEMSIAIDTVERMAMCYPDIEFVLNDTIRFLPGERIMRVADILGREFKENSIEVNGRELSGFISRPGYTKGTAASQYFFVNGRSVKDRNLLGALRAAYMDVCEKGQFPAAALWLTLPPADVDVNAHPQKAEVRFKEQARVRALVISEIRHALGQARVISAPIPVSANIAERFAAEPLSVAAPMVAEELAGFDFGESINPDSVAVDAPTEEEVAEHPLGLARGQIFLTYIIAQAEDGLVIVDAHACAERITYERIKASLAETGVARQMLLIPEAVELGQKRAGALLDMAEEMAMFGLVIEAFGEGSVLVREAPALLGQCDIAGLVKHVADDIEDMSRVSNLEDKIAMVAKTYACHTSLRAGKALTIDEMNQLLRSAENCPDAGVCNHGRPSFIKMSKKELDKLFDR
ncbi:MAG: DNA mismatch repair endonuclease MutL [Rickettsiales bacterium]|jgi:DNA mismatch repair protein MutL|nr:DNA mismatch repair endonuclease MutL [Rickettsiales bacterium]